MFVVGERVSDKEGHRGTVRFFGAVPRTDAEEEAQEGKQQEQQQWVGVEWDDLSRGRHRGEVERADGTKRQVFQCEKDGAYGSFVKPKKLLPKKSFMRCLQERYVALDAPRITEAVEGEDAAAAAATAASASATTSGAAAVASGTDRADVDVANLPGAFVSTASGQQKQIEFVGEMNIRKRQQLAQVHKVTIRNDLVGVARERDLPAASGGTAAEADAVSDDLDVSHITELDLQNNLLWSWDDVQSIGATLPQLQSLRLDKNFFSHWGALATTASTGMRGIPPQPPTGTAAAAAAGGNVFASLRILALNNCGLRSWTIVQQLVDSIEPLEELYVGGNAVGHDMLAVMQELVDNDDAGEPLATATYHNLRALDISNCGLTDWTQGRAFRLLPRLREFNVSENALSVVEPLDSEDTQSFPALHWICLSHTQLDSWDALEALNTFHRLTALRIWNVPLLHRLGTSEARILLIARLQKLDFLNGSPVAPRERVEAEKAYLRAVAREQQSRAEAAAAAATADSSGSTNGSSLGFDVFRQFNHEAGAATGDSGLTVACRVWDAETLRRHPRAAELLQLHGRDMAPMAGPGDGARSLTSDMIRITLSCVAPSCGAQEPKEKRLPCTMTVAKLQVLLKKLFGLEPRLQSLCYRADRDAPPTVLDDLDQTLSYYGVTEGAEVFMNEIDEAAEAQQQALEEREREAELQRQLERREALQKLQRDEVSAATAAAAARSGATAAAAASGSGSTSGT